MAEDDAEAECLKTHVAVERERMKALETRFKWMERCLYALVALHVIEAFGDTRLGHLLMGLLPHAGG